MIGTQKGTIKCALASKTTYICFLPDNSDIAKEAIRNGYAKASETAPEEYKQAEQEAKKEKLGVWL